MVAVRWGNGRCCNINCKTNKEERKGDNAKSEEKKEIFVLKTG